MSDLENGPGFTLCACGLLVQGREWIHGRRSLGIYRAKKGVFLAGTPAYWRPLPELVTPALGLPHRCGERGPEAPNCSCKSLEIQSGLAVP